MGRDSNAGTRRRSELRCGGKVFLPEHGYCLADHGPHHY